MSCCLTAPSHYLSQCWLIVGEVLWHSSVDMSLKITDLRLQPYLPGQWVSTLAIGQIFVKIFADILKCISLKKSCLFILNRVLLKIVARCPVDNKLAWCQTGKKPLSEPILTRCMWYPSPSLSDLIAPTHPYFSQLIFNYLYIEALLLSPELKNLLEFKYLPEKSWNLI